MSTGCWAKFYIWRTWWKGAEFHTTPGTRISDWTTHEVFKWEGRGLQEGDLGDPWLLGENYAVDNEKTPAIS
jgi:hypothetical protein